MSSFASAFEYFFGSYPVAAALILIGACYLTWRISVKLTKMQTSVDGIKKLPCENHSARLDKHHDAIATMREEVKEINTKVDFLIGMVNSAQPHGLITSIRDFSDKHSPRTLNTYGLDILEKSGGMKFLEENKGFLVGEIEKLKPKTALDVENFALGVLRFRSNDDIFIPLKNWVYNAPSMEVAGEDGALTKKDISMDDVLFIVSLPLRDIYLKEHPDLMTD